MRHSILTIIAILICIRSSKAQDSLSVLLLQQEKQVFFASGDSLRQLALLEKAKIYFARGCISQDAARDIKRVELSVFQNLSEKKQFLFNSALLFFLTNDFNNASRYYNSMLELEQDTCIAQLLLGVLIYDKYDTKKVTQLISLASLLDTSVVCLGCLNDVYDYEWKNKKLAAQLSRFIPGSGSMMSGYIGKGLTSLFIFGGIGTGIYFLAANELYWNAALTALPWFGKFYGGQIRLAKKLAEEKELKHKSKMAKSCSEKLLALLSKYPIQFNALCTQ
jgi:TM2 domain-containing membrane protein YozV